MKQKLKSGITISTNRSSDGVLLTFDKYMVYLSADEAIELSFEILKQAGKIDPWAEAKFQGLGMMGELLRKTHLIKKWKKIPGFEKVRKAYAKQHGHEPKDWDVAQFFLGSNVCCTSKRNGKSRSPIEELRRGNVDIALRAAELDGEMGR